MSSQFSNDSHRCSSVVRQMKQPWVEGRMAVPFITLVSETTQRVIFDTSGIIIRLRSSRITIA